MRLITRAAVTFAIAGSALVVPATAAMAVDNSGSVPTVVTPCHVDYRVVANLDTYGTPPVKTSGTDVGVKCP